MKSRAIILIAATLLTAACTKQLGEAGEGTLTIKATEANCSPSNQFLSVSATGEWKLSITFSDQTEYDFTPWAYFGKYTDVDSISLSGNGDTSLIQFNWCGNQSPYSRTATLKLTNGSITKSFDFKQNGLSKSSSLATVLESDDLGEWMELPETNTQGLYYFNHMMTVNGKSCRNYSYGWDPNNLVALWVAYPLNSFTIGSGSRSNEWGLDPKVPRRYQPILYSPFQGFYDRGHQCPSADRLSYEANVETFYGTNMTPQKAALNQSAWGVLEGNVRNWARKFDTLYVVTGCVVKGSTAKAYDNDGKAVTVPTGYYKALLGYKKSGGVANTSSNGGYTAIGFYFDHKAYDKDTQALMNQAVTIDRLEEITGLNFFVNLEKTSSAIAQRVEANYHSWWGNNM